MALMQVSKSPDSAIWLHCIQQWFPRLHTETYFVPPVHFNRVPYDTQTLAGHALLVAHEAEGGAGQSSQAPPRQASKKRPSQTPNLNQSSTNNPSQLFHQVFPQTYSSPSSSFKPTHVEDKDVRDDTAQRRVLHGLRVLADKLGEVMVVISQLQFGNYLNKPTYAAAASLLPKPVNMAPKYRQGDFDILVIHSQFGLVAGEIKSVGDNFAQLKMTQQEEDAIVAQAVEKAVKQLAKSWQVLRFLVHDQPGVNISKALLLPNVSSSQLLRAINGHPQTMQALLSCLGTMTTDEAVSLCLCKEQMSPLPTGWDFPESALREICEWWQRLMAVSRPFPNISTDVYEHLVARFVGPATTVHVYCITPPRLEIRTQGEGVAETGNRMAQLCLYPEQVDILNRNLSRMFLTGPPGTGKTVMLYLKGMQWLQTGYDVHIVSSTLDSLPASYLLEHLMLQTQVAGSTASRPPVVRHDFNFKIKKKDTKTAVTRLEKASSNGQLCVILDEAESIQEFCTELVSRVPNVNMWVASVYNYNIPDCLIVEKVTVAIRSPPVVMQEVGRAATIGRDVASYSISCVPAPADGPAIKRLYHNKTPGHTEPDVIDDYIEECEQCGRDIARVLAELQVGNSGQGVNISGKQLHYRDVLVLCNYPSDDKVDSDGRVISPASGLVRGLRACHVPVRVVQDGLLEADVLDLVLSLRDEVIVAHWGRVQGLERKVVVVKDLGQMFYFHASSRCTSQLVVIDYKAPGEPEDIMENCDVSYDSDDKSDTMFGTNDDLIDDDESSDIDNTSDGYTKNLPESNSNDDSEEDAV